ncbi:MAG TPA: hypothetical protein DCS07_03820 [Bdellovibrionales bacterium]|nr:MAG: hypothetical protein A2Z97_02680 [Bdellovibrionales bacterium GWB1_52_6]OFZ03473.1 MAG: hypothetical protein A2X97_05875 [Bdellovibrionales bacterium GWA1_52_35]OFZ41359.1 MAG: hypothetical protein A2070_05215 [Bdellovibrionales bacterium GWC1_52_8]HAR41746.1 hypothetical protein [Bdellovibrionales bacterium]HCM41057.1 hypothetical protein [Bdellovibrionales bacterium]
MPEASVTPCDGLLLFSFSQVLEITKESLLKRSFAQFMRWNRVCATRPLSHSLIEKIGEFL